MTRHSEAFRRHVGKRPGRGRWRKPHDPQLLEELRSWAEPHPQQQADRDEELPVEDEGYDDARPHPRD